MKVVHIQPLSSKKENLSLLGVVILILLFAHMLIQMTEKKEDYQSVSQNQISAYEDLSNVNNSFYTDILNSLIDVQAIFDETNKIPNISVLEEEGLPPYAKDSIWENRGSVQWKKILLQGKVCYLGLSQDLNVVGNFLIIFSKDIEKSKVYFNKDRMSQEELRHSLVHLEGHWKEILPYTGKDERKKF